MMVEALEKCCNGGCSVFVVCVEADLYDESDTRELPPAGQTFVHKIYHEMSVKQMTVDIQAAIWPALKNTCSVTQPLVGWTHCCGSHTSSYISDGLQQIIIKRPIFTHFRSIFSLTFRACVFVVLPRDDTKKALMK
jgi:hypothetical protein